MLLYFISVFIAVPTSKLKTKMYLALQSLELDLTKMMHMFRYVRIAVWLGASQNLLFYNAPDVADLKKISPSVKKKKKCPRKVFWSGFPFEKNMFLSEWILTILCVLQVSHQR